MELHELDEAAKVLAPHLIEEYQKSQLPTLRDQFAMAAMQALLSNPEYSVSRDDAAKHGSGDAVTAHYAYMQADAMLEARAKWQRRITYRDNRIAMFEMTDRKD